MYPERYGKVIDYGWKKTVVRFFPLALLVPLASLLLGGCVYQSALRSTAQVVPLSKRADLTTGLESARTTEDVRRLLGLPTQRACLVHNGKTIEQRWFYAGLQVPKEGAAKAELDSVPLTVFFNKDGQVEKFVFENKIRERPAGMW